jgi:hypothetical protein
MPDRTDRRDVVVFFVNDSESLDVSRERRLGVLDDFFFDDFESEPSTALADSLAAREDPLTLRLLDIFLREMRLDVDPT